MSSSTQDKAEMKFWQTPELVEKLLEHLDASATLGLAEAHWLTLQILQGDSGTLKPFKKLTSLIGRHLAEDTFEQQRVLVERVVLTILATMESPEPLLVELLDAICAEHKTDAIAIQVTCPCLASTHSVSSLGFLLLEDCEGALGSAEQSVKRISWDEKLDNFLADPLLFALTSRVSRQEGSVVTLDLETFVVRSKNHAEALYTLLEKSDTVYKMPKVKVCGDIGTEGWEVLAKAFNLHDGTLVCQFSALAEVMRKARREDLRSIWDAEANGPWRTNGSWTVLEEKKDGSFLTVKRLFKSRWTEEKNERNWEELVDYLDEQPLEVDWSCCNCS